MLRKITAIICVILFYLIPLSDFNASLNKSNKENLIMGFILTAAFSSLIIILWLANFSKSRMIFFKKHGFISKLLITIASFYAAVFLLRIISK